ncbi:MAG: preprotein translocase subunit SecE [Gemmatimonadetes bacterium]|nr:preprotein translocase subunit SecE [Gemmatimonadota bacterium]
MSKAMAMATRSFKYFQDVRSEVKKITWPTWEDLRQHTVAIIIVVTIIGVIIGLMDWFFSMTLIRGLGGILG